MGLFSRRRKDDEAAPAETDAQTDDAPAEDEAAAAAPTGRGPWDVADVPELGQRLDLGALRVPARPGLKLRMEMDKRTRQVVATSLSVSGSALQLQAFAAPRSGGLWADLRPEIVASVEKQGGTADEVAGPFGREILARLPVTSQDGRMGHRPARFIGADGPRWFLRGVLSGRAAVDPDAATELEDLFADVVVVRGQEARPPRDVLVLRVPGKANEEATAEETPTTSFDPLARGPEITEIR
ncbi:Protein of unknown function [Georgenia satyanarayanai]|uniref:DUF3710 domain-containing protein n=1 Tax=Georgenia satyanarayanai TaxID=860221 RepID=A0A2Y9BV71_9MICO|nr:DUF3710 domain-containing protein [Georgenia satyanarayanai]PYG02041.1 uncharacterized protein DUF3710 [Georgenia satyanarayanai]SSA36852.1 Protein of unknown function [Georgenia satyanarayanai]